MDEMNLPFFISVQELLKNMIYFVQDITDKQSDPMTCNEPPNKKRQKIMRECRFIDVVIDCLIYPFSTELYKYEDLTLQHPITKICRLVYRLLRLCVKDNSLNKE